MDNAALLTAYLADQFPSIHEASITDPAMREARLARARKWHRERTATGFERALVEFKALQGCRHWSRKRTLEQARESFRRAGMME